MDKKLIIGIVALILIVLVGGVFAIMNEKIQNSTEKLEQEIANSNINVNNKQENRRYKKY